MKRRILSRILIFTVTISLLLAGCSKKQAGNTPNADPNTGSGEGRAPSLPMQLALGTLSLEDTQNAVTSEQATELLPLWKAVKSLSASDNVTQREMDGLYKQIQEAMTPEQMQAIQSMDLSGENMAEMMKKLGIKAPMAAMGTPSPEMQATMEARRSSGQQGGGSRSEGGFGGGMGPDFGGGPPPGFSNRSQNNQGEQSQQNRPRVGFNSVFADAVIKLLEEKTQ